MNVWFSFVRILQVFLRRGSFSCSHCTVSHEDVDRSTVTQQCRCTFMLTNLFFADEDSGVVDLIPSASTTEALAEFPWVSSSTITHLRNVGLKVYLM